MLVHVVSYPKPELPTWINIDFLQLQSWHRWLLGFTLEQSDKCLLASRKFQGAKIPPHDKAQPMLALLRWSRFLQLGLGCWCASKNVSLCHDLNMNCVWTIKVIHSTIIMTSSPSVVSLISSSKSQSSSSFSSRLVVACLQQQIILQAWHFQLHQFSREVCQPYISQFLDSILTLT